MGNIRGTRRVYGVLRAVLGDPYETVPEMVFEIYEKTGHWTFAAGLLELPGGATEDLLMENGVKYMIHALHNKGI